MLRLSLDRTRCRDYVYSVKSQSVVCSLKTVSNIFLPLKMIDTYQLIHEITFNILYMVINIWFGGWSARFHLWFSKSKVCFRQKVSNDPFLLKNYLTEIHIIMLFSKLVGRPQTEIVTIECRVKITTRILFQGSMHNFKKEIFKTFDPRKLL